MGVVRGKASAYASAAALTIGLAVGLVVLSRSSSISLADVQAALAGQTWVHVKFDNSREEWTNLRDGRHFVRDVGGTREGRTVYLEPATGLRLVYWPAHGQYIERDNIGHGPIPGSPWEVVIGPLEQRAQTSYSDFTRQEETIDGRRLIRFDEYRVDALGQKILYERIWADPATRLPVRIWRKLDLAARQEQNREAVTGQYEFPATGPSGLEDLGVPPNLPVVDTDLPTPQDAQRIIDAGQAAKNRFPRRYRAIRYELKSPVEIVIFWRDADRFRFDLYPNIQPRGKDYDEKGWARYHLDLPATADQILAWARQHEDVHSTYIDANGRSYSRRNPHPAIANGLKQPEAGVHKYPPGRREPSLVNSGSWPHKEPWPYVNAAGPWQVIGRSEDTPAGCICLRREAGDSRRDCIIDLAHDYICVNYIWWKQKGNQWIRERQDQLLDLQQLPGGQWCPTRWQVQQWSVQSAGEIYQSTSDYRLDMKVLDEADFPPDLFSGEKLLEGAKVETY